MALKIFLIELNTVRIIVNHFENPEVFLQNPADFYLGVSYRLINAISNKNFLKVRSLGPNITHFRMLFLKGFFITFS